MRGRWLLLSVLAPRASGKACEGEDLAPDTPLRVGTIIKVDDCERRSQPGDKLKMHYTVSRIHAPHGSLSVALPHSRLARCGILHTRADA